MKDRRGQRKKVFGGAWIVALLVVAPSAWCAGVGDDGAVDAAGYTQQASLEKTQRERVCHGRMLAGYPAACAKGSWREWLVRGREESQRIAL